MWVVEVFWAGRVGEILPDGFSLSADLFLFFFFIIKPIPIKPSSKPIPIKPVNSLSLLSLLISLYLLSL